MLADSRGVLIGDWVNLDNDPEWAELLGVADRWAVLRRAGGSVCIREVEEYVGLVELVEPRSSDDLGPLGLPAGSVDDVDRIYNLAMAFDNADCAVATAGCSLPTWPAFKLDLSREIVATCNRIWPRPFA